LNALRPVYVEPSAALPRTLHASTVPEGLLLRVRSEGVTKRDARDAEALNAQRLSRLMNLNATLSASDLARTKIARSVAAQQAP
jgi:hypothetical protein